MPNETQKQLMLEFVTLFQTEPISRLTERVQGEGRLLFYLLEHPKQAIPSEISQSLSLSRPRVTSILNSLQKKGLVELKTNPEDRRKVNVTLTPEGLDYIALKKSHTEEILDAYIRAMGPEDISELIRLLKRSNEIMREQTQQQYKED